MRHQISVLRHFQAVEQQTTMAEPSSFDAALREEGRLLRIYEAELALLKKKRAEEEEEAAKEPSSRPLSPSFFLSSEHDGGAADDPLEWILQAPGGEGPSVSSLVTSLRDQEDTYSEDISSLQPALRNFCFTAVNRAQGESYSTNSTNHEAAGYVFRGYFVADPSVEAEIRMVFSLGTTQEQSTSIQSMRCTLRSSTGDDWTWLEQQVSAVLNNHEGANLPAWIECVSNYLEFDARRKKCLEELRFAEKILPCTSQQQGNHAVLQIPLGDPKEEDAANRLSIVWGWKWREARDSLRLNQASSGLKQADLDQLVVACDGDCWTALQLITQYEPVGEDESSSSGEEESVVEDMRVHKRRRDALHLQHDPVHDADDEGDGDDPSDDDGTIDSAATPKGAELKNPEDAFRLSPSGRRRSDYEVERLIRIQRNELKLVQLGLMKQNQLTTPSPAKKKKRKLKGKRKRIVLA
jgi:hypothetical protein